MPHPQNFLFELWRTLWQSNIRGRQVCVACAAILTSMGIGYRYANEPFISILPILLWLYSILICFTFLYPVKNVSLFQIKFNRTWIKLSSLLLIAFFLRIVNLLNFPPAFLPDEAGSVEFALQNVFNPSLGRVTINPMRTGLDSQPILHSYILWLSTTWFGFSTAGVRVFSVLAGTLSVAGVFLMVNEMAGRKMAWLTAILITVYHYHIHWSRIALSNIWVTLFLPLTLGFFLRGWRKGTASGALLAGLSLGFSAYFYTGGYVLIFLIAIIVWQTWHRTKDHVSLTIYIGKMLSLATVVAAPLIVFAWVKPDHFFDRFNVVYGWSPAAIKATLGDSASNWDYFIYQFTHSFGSYNFYSDVTHFYAPQIPFLIGITSILFLIGISQALYKKQYFPVLWVILVTILGGVMIVGTPASSHFIPVIPAICWLVAIPIHWVGENKKRYWVYILLSAIIIVDLSFYFIVYPKNLYADFTAPFPLVEPYVY
jgi:4-amino-4-deoxy-L-arabinose transferase-like glycosyltransferase